MIVLDGLPSQETRSIWIHAFRQVGDYPDPTEFSGKWLVWFHAALIDRYWLKIKDAVEQGYLGDEVKVLTRHEGRSWHVICVYTYDWSDIIDCMGIREALRSLGVRQKLKYKADEDTRNLRYGNDYTPIYRA